MVSDQSLTHCLPVFLASVTMAHITTKPTMTATVPASRLSQDGLHIDYRSTKHRAYGYHAQDLLVIACNHMGHLSNFFANRTVINSQPTEQMVIVHTALANARVSLFQMWHWLPGRRMWSRVNSYCTAPIKDRRSQEMGPPMARTSPNAPMATTTDGPNDAIALATALLI